MRAALLESHLLFPPQFHSRVLGLPWRSLIWVDTAADEMMTAMVAHEINKMVDFLFVSDSF